MYTQWTVYNSDFHILFAFLFPKDNVFKIVSGKCMCVFKKYHGHRGNMSRCLSVASGREQELIFMAACNEFSLSKSLRHFKGKKFHNFWIAIVNV